MSAGNGSREKTLEEAYKYLEGWGLPGSLETIPETEETAARNIDPDRLKNLKQARTAAKSKLTIIKKTILNNLMSTRTLQSKVDSSEKDFQKAFTALNEAHGYYMAAKEDEGDDLDPKDVDYMEGPIEDQIVVGEKWTEWHMAKDEELRAERDADVAKLRKRGKRSRQRS